MLKSSPESGLVGCGQKCKEGNPLHRGVQDNSSKFFAMDTIKLPLLKNILQPSSQFRVKRALFNPTALRKAKIVYNFGLSECNRVKLHHCFIMASLTARSSIVIKIQYFFGYKTEFFFHPKQSQKSRSIL